MSFYDILLAKKLEDKRDPQVKGLTVTENGSYSETGTVYNVVNVNVPQNTGYKLKDAPSGSISTFNDGVDLPLNKLVVDINGVGYSECNLTRCGKNLFDIHIDKDTPLTTITFEQPINQPITISAVDNNIIVNDSVWRITITLKDGTTSRIGEQGFWGGTFPKTINGSDSNPIVSISYRGENITSGSYDLQVELGSTPTTYEAYQGNTYQIDFPSGVTISNGSIDILNGVLTDNDLEETYNITPTAVRSLQGTNNIFADTGDVEELEYFTT